MSTAIIDKAVKDELAEGSIERMPLDLATENRINAFFARTSGYSIVGDNICRFRDKRADDSDHEYYYLVCISGGLNGHGKWSDYFDELSRIMFFLEREFASAWVVNVDNDCCDDVHYVIIGLRNKTAK